MRHIFFIALFLWLHCAYGQVEKTTYFPEASVRQQIILDPVASQNSISFARLALNDTIKESLYVPTSIGFYKALLQKKGKIISELGIDVVALSQFGIKKVEDDPHYTAKYQLNLLNIDFKASLVYTIKNEQTSYRIRLYHLSSHLGDDYLLRYGYDMNGYWRNNPRNYEQLDFFMFQHNLHFDYFVGTGLVVSPNSKRDRLSFQGGINLHYPLGKDLSVFSGLFLSAYQETAFSPSAKMALGIDTQRELKILIEYYEGNMPYSTFEEIHMNYFGIGLYLSDL